jgi:hypothetical protein
MDTVPAPSTQISSAEPARILTAGIASEALASSQPAASAPRTTPPAAPTPAEPEAPQTPKATPTAHDIKLEVASGEQRVEVRLVERAGEVHLAVRTPDQRLSGALRDNLPELAARLEGTGFRPAASTAGNSSGERHASPQPQSPSDSQSQPDGRQRQRDAEPQSQENSPIRNRKEKGNSFAWFMSSAR